LPFADISLLAKVWVVAPDPADRRWSFDSNAERYHAWRPGYPEPLYWMLEDVCGLGPGTRVLEIGPGSGQATADLLARGAEVVAVEMGPHLAARLRDHLGGPNLTVIEGDVESVRLPDGDFDLAVCATALHWMHAAAVVPKVAAALRPGGWLAVWWTVFGDPDRTSPLRGRLHPMLRERFPAEPDGSRPAPLQTADRLDELTAGGWFQHARAGQIRWTPRFSPAELAGLFSTFPHIAELPVVERDAVLDDIAAVAAPFAGDDGKVTENYVIAIYLARRLCGLCLLYAARREPAYCRAAKPATTRACRTTHIPPSVLTGSQPAPRATTLSAAHPRLASMTIITARRPMAAGRAISHTIPAYATRKAPIGRLSPTGRSRSEFSGLASAR
jgi:SAM-dependent methyltransferase